MAIWDLFSECGEEKTSKKANFKPFWPLFRTLWRPARVPLVITNGLDYKSWPLTNFLQDQRLRGAYSCLQIWFLPWKSSFFAFMTRENANSSVKINCKTSIWSWLPLYIHGLGYWQKIRSFQKFWFIIILRLMHFFQKTAILGLFFSFFGAQNLAKPKYQAQPPNPCFYCGSPQKTDLRYQFLSNFWFFSFCMQKMRFWSIFPIFDEFGWSQFQSHSSKTTKIYHS